MNVHIKNTIWLYLGGLLIVPISYFIRILNERNLSLVDFGIFYGLFGFFALFGFIRDWGLNSAAIYFANEAIIRKDNSKFKALFLFNHLFQLVMSFVICLFLYLMKDWIFNFFYGREILDAKAHIYEIFSIFLGYWFFVTIVETNKQYLSVFENQKMNSIIDFIFYFIILLTTILFTFFIRLDNYITPPLAYFLGVLSVSTISSIFLLIKYKEYILEPKLILDIEYVKKIFNYSSSLIIAGFSSTLFVSTDIMIIQFFEGAKTVALYTVAVSGASILTIFFIPICSIINSLSAKLWHKNLKEKLSNVINFTTENMILVFTPICIMFAVCAYDFIDVIYTKPDLLAASILMQILSIGMIISSLNVIFAMIISSIGRPKDLSKITLYSGIFNLVGNIISIRIFGLLGVVICTFMTYILTFICSYRVIRSELSISINIFYYLKLVLASCIFFFMAVAMRDGINLFITSIQIINFIVKYSIIFTVAFIFYCMVLFILNALNKERLASFKYAIKSDV